MIKKSSIMAILVILLLILSSCSAPSSGGGAAISEEATEETTEETAQESSSKQEEDKNKTYAPDFSLEDLDGNIITLASFGGKNLIINFWATWCPFCVDEMPDLQKLYENYKDEDLVVIAINIQESKSRVTKFLEDEGIDLPILLDEKGTTAITYGANSIPLTIAVNKEGVVVAGHRGKLTYEQMEAMYEIILENQ
jgi:thiol-disulfide isomerase/thioredoxin